MFNGPGSPDGHSAADLGPPMAECEVLEAPTLGVDPGARISGLLAHRQQIEAELLIALAEAERSGVLTAGRFRSTAAWLAGHTRQPQAQCRADVVDGVLLFDEVPELGQAFTAGVINRSHVGCFGRLWRKPTLRTAFRRDVAVLIGFASFPWPQFQMLVRAWAEAAEPADTADQAEEAFEQRSLAVAHGLGGVSFVEMRTPTALWAQIEDILTAAADELFEQDWAELRARLGDEATTDQLPRTQQQRLHDALVMTLRAGAGGQDPGVAPQVNVVIDYETLKNEAMRAASHPGAASPGVEPDRAEPDWVRDGDEIARRARAYRSESLSGTPINPADVLTYAIAGRLRVFVTNVATRSVEVSRVARLFTGSLRDAIILRDRHCATPGCGVAAVRSEIDHITPYAHGGPTSLANGEALCRPCHRHKTRMQALGLWPHHHDPPTTSQAA